LLLQVMDFWFPDAGIDLNKALPDVEEETAAGQ
jgi:hypothetical protein